MRVEMVSAKFTHKERAMWKVREFATPIGVCDFLSTNKLTKDDVIITETLAFNEHGFPKFRCITVYWR